MSIAKKSLRAKLNVDIDYRKKTLGQNTGPLYLLRIVTLMFVRFVRVVNEFLTVGAHMGHALVAIAQKPIPAPD